MTLLSGFTFIRNAVKYDFPIVEAIESMLPIVDELVINVGKSEDQTEDLLQSLASKHKKFKLIHSIWDDTKTKDGLVLSEQTNIALNACSGKWCLYLQADEALHEKELSSIRQAVELEDRKSNPVDAFSFQYLHFYGGYQLIARSWNWYPTEIRILRKDSGALSFGDAQTFKKADGSDLKTKLLNAHVYHYGHARDPQTMQRKISYFHRFWHGDSHQIKTDSAYTIDYKNLVWFWSSHPNAYFDRVQKGIAWSAKPQDIKIEKIKSIVILTDKTTVTLAEEVASLLTIHGIARDQITVVTSIFKWIKTVIRCMRHRKNSVLIDLGIENRNPLFAIGMLCDSMFAFKTRIAHAPQGTLPKFFSKFFTYISWGAHEVVRTKKEFIGFRVPESQYARQLLRWMGINS